MTLNHLVILTNNCDWQALFLDGKLVQQAHEIVPTDLAKHCPIGSIAYEETSLAVHRHLQVVGQFPDDISLEQARAFTGAQE